jgi:hypothetical protein
MRGPDAEHLDLGGISFEAAGSHLSSVFAIFSVKAMQRLRSPFLEKD